jgi:hypothetical protein
MKIFLSWSGKQSQEIANAFNMWLPRVIQAVKPWFSPNIEKGAKWSAELDKALEGTRFGIVCLTPDNLPNPWLHYEAGALSKTEGARVWTFLHGGLSPSDVAPPLSSFQATTSEKSEVFKLLQSINERLKDDGGNALTDNVLNDVFEDTWPKLDNYLGQVKYDRAECGQPHVRGEREILEEILELVRGYQVQVEQVKYEMMSPNYFSRSQPSGITRSTKELRRTELGAEVEVIRLELYQADQYHLLMALDQAKDITLLEGKLFLTYSSEDKNVGLMKEASKIFHSIGLRLFGHPIDLRIRIDPGPPPDPPYDPEPPDDNDIPF